LPNERVSMFEIYYWIQENKDKINSVASGATFKEISRSEFRGFDFLIADKAIHEKFIDLIDPIGKQIQNLIARNINLRQQRDLLLPRLVSGNWISIASLCWIANFTHTV